MRDESNAHWHEIAVYLAGEGSPAERASLEQWVGQTPGARALVEDLDRAWDRIQWPSHLHIDVDAIMAHVAGAIGVPKIGDGERALSRRFSEDVGQRLGTGPRSVRIGQERGGRFSGQPLLKGMRGLEHRSLWRSFWYATAGIIAAAALIIVGWADGAHDLGRRIPSAMMTYTTANGQRGTVTLTDGSTVMLNVASRLDVPADYAAGDRTVRLVGEGLITSSHHEGTPLTVVSGPTVTRVLGTSFAVRRYATDTTTTVAVREGKVAVDRAVVAAGKMIEVGSNGVTRAGDAAASQFDFVVGVLALRGVTLAQAIPELDRWYDADIRLGDRTLAAAPFEGNVSAGTLANLAELLAVTFDVHVVRDGRVLTLFPR